MRLTIIVNVFLRDFRKQKKRITLTLLALGWGTVSIMLLLAFGEGLKRQMTINSRGLGEGIIMLWPGQTTKPYKGLNKGRRIRFTAEDVELLKSRMPELKLVGGEYADWGITYRYKEKVMSGHLTGIYPNYEEMRTHYPQSGGRMINNLDMQLKRRVIFLGDELKTSLFGDEDALGKQILINNTPFTVIGVMIHKIQNNMYSGPDANKGSIPATTFSTLFGYRYLQLVMYKPFPETNIKSAEQRVREVLAAKYKFDPSDERAINVWDLNEENAVLGKIMIGLQMFLGIIGGLTLLIAGVGVANIMYVSIKERTREIGIKMALGARRSYITAQFLVEAMIITVIGGFGGMFISYLGTEAFKRVPIKSEIFDWLGRPTISFQIGLVVVLILGVMGVLSGLFPALKASKVNPVDSLRYE